MIKILCVVSVVLVVVVAGFMWYMGIFSPVKVYEMPIGPYTYVYESFVGDYTKTGPIFEKIYRALLKEGLKPTRGIGLYYDDPKTTPKDKLRSDCGSIIEKGDLLKVPGLMKRGFKTRIIMSKPRVVAEFPIRNGLSYMIGPMKVYPALDKYLKGQGKSAKIAYEVYDMPAKKTIYFVDTQ